MSATSLNVGHPPAVHGIGEGGPAGSDVVGGDDVVARHDGAELGVELVVMAVDLERVELVFGLDQHDDGMVEGMPPPTIRAPRSGGSRRSAAGRVGVAVGDVEHVEATVGVRSERRARAGARPRRAGGRAAACA